MRRRALVLAGVAALVLAAPAAAWAHAALLRTFPQASQLLDTQPGFVRLTYDEVVEPRFAIVSVTDANGQAQATGSPERSPSDPYTIQVPVRRLAEGWYLVFWRAISADGHPVRGAFTFQIGPNPGPAPQFVIPPLTETAATPGLVAVRWLTFVTVMTALGLFFLRAVVARPVRERLTALTVAFGAVVALALVAVPVYVDVATAQFALRPWWDVGAVVPLMTGSAFGRGLLDLELMLALFALAAAVALRLDRPERGRRSVAALLALWGALLAGGATLVAPGAAGHAAQTAPRWLSLALDWTHLAAGSLWLGGLLGLLVLWWRLPAALGATLPRFSNTAFLSVLSLIGSGTGAAVIHLPTFSSLWETSYGTVLLVKIGLLAVALLGASVNLVRTRRRELAVRRLVGGEALLVAAIVAAAAVLSSLPPPARALAGLGKPAATTGPGPVTSVVEAGGYRLELSVEPNRVGVANQVGVRILRGGRPVDGLGVTATFTMLDMDMPNQTYALAARGGGLYERSLPALVMVGRWGLRFELTPPRGTPFDVLVVDHASG